MFNTNNKHRFSNLYVSTVANLKFYICFIIVLIQLITVSTFSSFNLSVFTEEDGTTINNEHKQN